MASQLIATAVIVFCFLSVLSINIFYANTCNDLMNTENTRILEY